MVLCLASFQIWIQGTFLQNGYLSSKDVRNVPGGGLLQRTGKMYLEEYVQA